jgi:hypothetical protein
MDAARELMKMIKAERYFGNPPKLTSHWIAETVRNFRERLPFASFFRHDSVLVPLPSSSLMQRDSLWGSRTDFNSVSESWLRQRIDPVSC